MLNECQLFLSLVLKHLSPVYFCFAAFTPNQFSPTNTISASPYCVPGTTWALEMESSTTCCSKSKAKSEDTAHCWPPLEVISNPVCSRGTD